MSALSKILFFVDLLKEKINYKSEFQYMETSTTRTIFCGVAACSVVTYLPTIMSSHSDAWDLKLFHRSMVKMVLELLKMEVREDMRAAIITAIIRPRSPGQEKKKCRGE